MTPFSKEEWNACIKVLSYLKDDPFDNPDNELFKSLITKIHKNARKTIRKDTFETKKEEDLQVIFNSRIAANAISNTTSYSSTDDEPECKYQRVNVPLNCYACGASYNDVHFFYNRLCPKCAELNYAKRTTNIKLKGRNVILTGGRVKIGYATALKFLRSGANLILTTRFPALALELLKKEADYALWEDRLLVYGLDLKNLTSVENFISYIKAHYGSLDILVNNAAQTIKYPADYYVPLVRQEALKLKEYASNAKLLPNPIPLGDSLKLLDTNSHSTSDFVPNRFGQPVDYRMKNSWNSTLDEIGLYELLEVNFINHISPYVIIKELKPLFLASAFGERFIINVTSSEGQFSYANKTIFHPHTNMTKAALNMLTRTSAEDFANDNIFMNSVDVGWVSTGAHEQLRELQFERGYMPPLDSVDGASRIFHPIEEVLLNSQRPYGLLFKNYRAVEW